MGFGVVGVHGAGPAGADVDVVEVLGAVGVGLGPFAAEGGSEAVTEVNLERAELKYCDTYPVAGLELCTICAVHPEHAKLILFWCVKAI